MKYTLLSLLILYFIPFQSFAWYDTNASGTAPDWLYRVPINIPPSATQNSTIKLNVDFTSLFSTLGIAGVLDIQSLRVVRADDTTLVTSQEYSDRVYNDSTDAANNNRGEIKFIYDDDGANIYYLYFDTTASGAKSANPRPPINGNFEYSAAGTTPAQWTVTTAPAGVTNQHNEVHDTAAGATYSSGLTCSDSAISNVDNAPRSGRRWHLTGYRNNCEAGNLAEQIMLRKTFTVPASSPGNLTFYFQLQAFDDVNYDYFRVRVDGTVIDHTTLGVSNAVLTVSATKIGRQSGYVGGGLVDAGWELATFDLSAFAGSTITIELATVFAGDNVYRTWVKLDDVEWSVKTASLGTPEQNGPVLTLQKTSTVISDPIGSPNPKRIPGSVVEYTILASNSGSVVEYTILASNSGSGVADNNTIFIADPIPSNTHFIVNSIQFNPSAPVNSGLTANSSNYSYSLDGGATYGSTQTTVITHFKVAPQGVFLAPSGSGSPAFTVKYRVTVD